MHLTYLQELHIYLLFIKYIGEPRVYSKLISLHIVLAVIMTMTRCNKSPVSRQWENTRNTRGSGVIGAPQSAVMSRDMKDRDQKCFTRLGSQLSRWFTLHLICTVSNSDTQKALRWSCVQAKCCGHKNSQQQIEKNERLVAFYIE